MESLNLTTQNIEKIEKIFPNCIMESVDLNGNPKKVINFDLLRQMLSPDVIEGDEAYEFTWVGKKAAIIEANKPIRKTLRPCKEESKNWDNTENLYIEGDNLEVLKLLQESYLGKVKMIYIDPPYNTGNDYIYRDDFGMTSGTYDDESGVYNDNGDRLFRNNDSNGRFHSDWCSMLYSRLLLSRNLLSEDGVIFISIDGNEEDNLKKICDELFGEDNLLGVIANINNPKGRSDDKFIATAHEYILVYAKNINSVVWYGFEPTDEKIVKRYTKIDDHGKKYREIDLRKTGENDLREDRPNLFYYFYYNQDTQDFFPDYEDRTIEGYIQIKPQREDGKEGNWRWGLDTAKGQIEQLVPKFMPARKVWGVMQKDYLEGRSLVKTTSAWTFKDVNSERGTEDFITLGFDKRIFPKPKPLGTIIRCIELSNKHDKESIILDFFSGSATTAHATMLMNGTDRGHRKYILVQLQEKAAENSETVKEGYTTISDIGKERIRRAGEKIKSENPDAKDLDIGFRVFKLDDTNMKDVYYNADDYEQANLDMYVSNIKEDRTDLDLLFGCLLEWGLPLSLPYSSESIEGCTVHNYNNGDLIACFDENVPESVMKEIAKKKPLRAVFRDSSFAGSPSKINVGEIFKMLSPDTRIKVL